MNSISIFWFRRDLRLHDNHGLYQALMHGDPVLCIFIFDTNILQGLENKKDPRVSFIRNKLAELNYSFASLGSSLHTFYDTPEKVFLRLTETFPIKNVFTNQDYEPYAIHRDSSVEKLLHSKGIHFHSWKDQVIFEKSEITKSDNTPYTIFTPYAKSWKEKFNQFLPKKYPSENLLNKLHQIKNSPVHTFDQIGFLEVKLDIPSSQPDSEIIRHYNETRNIPYVNGTSRLSIHLRFGTVSVRDLTMLANGLNEQWLNELIWREFFMMILFHFPRVVTESFKKKYDGIEWRNQQAEFEAWCSGETGYAMVDAGMRELNETGYMHNRVRMVVASFLTKHLLIDWRWGEAYFAEKLLDYELSSNNGNWQWCAGCGCDATPYFRIFSPDAQAKKFDPDMKYIKKWIKNYKPGYIDPVVDHNFARGRALEVYKKAVSDQA